MGYKAGWEILLNHKISQNQSWRRLVYSVLWV